MSRPIRCSGQFLVAALLVAAVLVSPTPVRAASPAPLGDIGETMLLAQKKGPAPSHLRDAPLEGSNFWIDFVSTRAGRLFRVFSDDVPSGAIDVGRFAHILTLGYQYARGMWSLELTNSVADAGQVKFPADGAVWNSMGFFTSPALTLSVRPVAMLRLDVEGSYSWAMAIGEGDTDHQLATAGFHVVFEPSDEYFGVQPRWEIAVGARFAWASFDSDPSVEGTALLFGGRATSIIPLGEEVALTFGFGAYAGFDPGDFGAFDAEEPNRHLNLEWTAGLRWFPLGG